MEYTIDEKIKQITYIAKQKDEHFDLNIVNNKMLIVHFMGNTVTYEIEYDESNEIFFVHKYINSNNQPSTKRELLDKDGFCLGIDAVYSILYDVEYYVRYKLPSKGVPV